MRVRNGPGWKKEMNRRRRRNRANLRRPTPGYTSTFAKTVPDAGEAPVVLLQAGDEVPDLKAPWEE